MGNDKPDEQPTVVPAEAEQPDPQIGTLPDLDRADWYEGDR
jgi:hypothetical protein